MIQTIIHRQGDLITGFELTGHADSGEYGQDIVCAAASALSITTTNALIAVAGVTPDVQSDSVNGGLLIVRVPVIDNDEQSLQAQTLLAAFELGMKEIAKQYSQYVNLKIN
ncbi:ribosomal-processing cysteine protease Prp [Nicoliella spurrieriana]|uniref:Ribosomal processing cysteine protease Prp n=1 Tax=Nicoliella spurrieriana TaxID=2925830 RepID=A0A976RRS2_9LACO|nr:ribosomal-processing cysteine protease Prp [Nicoliella spurrieriana]UQS86658.1 ribosomal-processing cysteine protease Prp [Nicoliella spurrieriana]